ncbi:MAG: FAD-dependent oxidoreductase [Candidatus Omnitrophota bacterium]
MKNITIIGAGEAGFTFACLVREKNKDAVITVIDQKPRYIDKKKLITQLDFKAYVDLKEWAQNLGITFIQDKVERLNVERGKIYCKENEPIDFELLVVAAGSLPNKLVIKGDHKDGLFYLSELDPLTLKDTLKISSEVLVYVSTVLGLELSFVLRALGKEVRIVADNFNFLENFQQEILELLQEAAVAVHTGAAIEEVIGEDGVRATKITPLKVFSSDAVFVDSGFLPNAALFENTVTVRDAFFTNYDNVYVLGDMNCQDISSERVFAFNCEEVKAQAHSLAEIIVQVQPVSYHKKQHSVEDKQNYLMQMAQRWRQQIKTGGLSVKQEGKL